MQHTMSKNKIINKIKKCLALANSSNQHEAAAALRQAHKMMKQYKLSLDDIDLHKITTGKITGSGNNVPPEYECYLAGNIGALFGCKVLFDGKHAGGINQWQFIGYKLNTELAQYAFQVAYRQLKKSRADYIASKLKRCKTRQTKTRRADLYCDAWVSAVYQVIKDSIKNDLQQEALIERYLQEHYPNLTEMQRLQRNSDTRMNPSDWRSYHAGQADGSKVVIHRGVSAADEASRMLEV